MPNRLAAESSPYLLQHAGNPVEWYAWGPEAFTKARREDRPILLSIGYSSCHWCHVMERESFEDEGVAALMNAAFVSVKVDREERPDIDQVYMRAVQAMTGQGGWPLTVFLTPEGDPYYGGTYFPPLPRHGMPSFRQVLEAAARAYAERPQDVRRGTAQLLSALESTRRGIETEGSGEAPSTALLDHGARFLARQFDTEHGGFGRAPKFPQPVTLEFLLRDHVRTGQPLSLDMAVQTLRRMAAGGIFDHLGGGFHRYSVDDRWLVPHFEKMLYDNALLARVYVDAYRITGFEDLRDVAERTFDYLLQDMRGPDGGFYTARDADSEGEEGRFYVWTPEQIRSALGHDEAELFMRCYDVTAGGNFEGRSILWLPRPLQTVASAEGLGTEELDARLATCRAVLQEVRDQREPPFRDEKVLTGWNAMTVRALAEAGTAFGRADYVDAAVHTADLLLDALHPNGRLMHVYKDGTARVPAFLEDHAALGNALLSLHSATLELRWLDEARRCCEVVLQDFWDEADGLFYDAPRDGERLFMRARDPMDNATPSGSSLAAELLVRAGHVFDDDGYRDVAVRAFSAETAPMRRFPSAFGRLFSVVDRWLADPIEVVIVGEPGSADTHALLHAASAPYHRSLSLVGRAPGADPGPTPLFEGRGTVDGMATAYVCERYACQAPLTDPEALSEALERRKP